MLRTISRSTPASSSGRASRNASSETAATRPNFNGSTSTVVKGGSSDGRGCSSGVAGAGARRPFITGTLTLDAVVTISPGRMARIALASPSRSKNGPFVSSVPRSSVVSAFTATRDSHAPGSRTSPPKALRVAPGSCDSSRKRAVCSSRALLSSSSFAPSALTASSAARKASESVVSSGSAAKASRLSSAFRRNSARSPSSLSTFCSWAFNLWDSAARPLAGGGASCGMAER
jgi:hypothetical protein